MKKIIHHLECSFPHKLGNNIKRKETIEKTVGKKSVSIEAWRNCLVWEFTDPIKAAEAYKALSDIPGLDTLELGMKERW